MKRGCIIYIILFFFLQGFSQTSDTLTLQACYDSLYSNYPLAKQRYLQERIRELKIKNVQNNYMPGFNMGAQSNVQSDVPHIEINSASPAAQNIINNLDIPRPPLWQNKIYLDISQNIYDGGLTSSQKKMENTNADIQQKKLDLDFFKLRENINELYYNLYYLKANERSIYNLKSDLENKRKKTFAAVNSGAMLESNLYLIDAELLKLDQQIAEIQSTKKNLISSIKDIIRREITESTVIFIPDYDIADPSMNGIHPNIELLNLNLKLIDNNILLTKAARHPKLFLFGQAGYGRPGLNMLSDKFDPYGYFGVRLNYTLFDWGQKSRNIDILQCQKDIITTQLETFELNQKIAIRNILNNIEKMEKILKDDDKIIELRSNISRISSSRYENGDLSARDYITEKNNETTALINKNLHKILLLNAKLNYLTVSGKMK